MQAIETSISGVEQAISQKLTAEISKLSSSLSPLHLLPDDILYLIFDTAQCAEWYPVTDRTAPLWVSSQTCQRWRSVALCNPSLWRRFCVDGRNKDFQVPKDPLSMVKAWLARSQSVPLQGRVYIEGYDPNIEEELMELVGDESHRWLELYLDVDRRVDLYYSFAAKEESFPLLRTLELVLCPFEDDDPTHNNRTLAFPGSFRAPNLTCASILIYTNSITMTRNIPTIPLPWHQLTHYTTIYYDQEFFGITVKLLNLQSLKLRIEYGSPQALSPSTPHLTLSNLRSLEWLEWHCGEVRAAVAFMNQLTLPVLEELVLGLNDAAIPSDEAADSLSHAIAALQQRSSCQIQELTICTGTLTSPNSARLSLPTVRVLHMSIDYLGQTDAVQQKAWEALRNSALYPNMTALHIELRLWAVKGHVDFIPALVEVIEARRTKASSAATRLASVRLEAGFLRHAQRCLFPADSSAYQRLLELQRDGLELSGSVFPW
ncbi:hypothetical protein AAF712_004628 [Marasmius tenuissimus]|uniref:F-box domain-containing protein n=1 Tax=Marasmius tenuissimus TaxID=585030 RepID=A0ABR3A3S8_9AGAR